MHASAGNLPQPATIEEVAARYQAQSAELVRFIEDRVPERHRGAIEAVEVVHELWPHIVSCVRRRMGPDSCDRAIDQFLLQLARTRIHHEVRTRECVSKGGQDHTERVSERSSLLAVFEELSNGARSPSSELAAAEVVAALRLAIDELPPRMRKAMMLREYDRASYADIGREMNRSEKAIHGLLVRARAKIRAKLVVAGVMPFSAWRRTKRDS